jgi:dTDP-4-dehydrorhamnose reductase
VLGTVRAEKIKRFFPTSIASNLVVNADVENQDDLVNMLHQIRPDVVINCVGLTKHKVGAGDPLTAIPINTLMPHRLAKLCSSMVSRLIHISTDCVFSGEKGGYVEGDFADARDIYGKSKALGEIDSPNAITLRTSTIGHELNSAFGLLDWFLSQDEQCRGFRRAIFSGLPTIVLAQIIRDFVIPQSELSGIYHVAARPINKYDLLKLIATEYGKSISIRPDDSVVLDRSLSAAKFNTATGYIAPEWPELIRLMHAFK